MITTTTRSCVGAAAWAAAAPRSSAAITDAVRDRVKASRRGTVVLGQERGRARCGQRGCHDFAREGTKKCARCRTERYCLMTITWDVPGRVEGRGCGRSAVGAGGGPNFAVGM